MKPLLKNALTYYAVKNRWYLAFIAGIFYALGTPPMNGELHPVFTFFPVLSFTVCIPLFYCSLTGSTRRALLHAYCFGIGASLCHLYWIAFVVPEGLYHLIVLGVALLTAFEAIFFALNAVVFRFTYTKFPRFSAVIFPAWWVVVEYVKSLGEISFPWNYIGYSLTPFLPLSQLSSVTGTYGLSFIVISGNVLLFNCIQAWLAGSRVRRTTFVFLGFVGFLVAVSGAGFVRLNLAKPAGPLARFALVQPVIDQNQWGNTSLDTSFSVIQSMVYEAAACKPDATILPESALLCYIDRRPSLKRRVTDWVRKTGVPLVFGALQWDPAPPKSLRDYFVYNTAFFLDTGSTVLLPYYKMKLVPFSEILPFQGLFPILSRVNLGQADFRPGTQPVIYTIGKIIRGAPFICFDIIYPSLVRSRASMGTNLLIQITNDGWFGRSSGPFQHALYAQQRCIENGISLARCANTGISMFVDQYGRIISRTKLGERRVLEGEVSLRRVPTLYSKIGDWPVAVSGIIIALQLISLVVGLFRKPASSPAPCGSSPEGINTVSSATASKD
jgi:apolipoprotein N-acyltransferase